MYIIPNIYVLRKNLKPKYFFKKVLCRKIYWINNNADRFCKISGY